jgi:LPS-assembly lipoprotein
MKRLVLVCTLFLAGCGFHLRGTTHTSQLQIHAVHLLPEKPYDKTQQDIRQQLINQHFDLENQNAPTLTIVSQRFAKQTLAYGSNGQVRRERIRYTLIFKLESLEGEILIPETEIHAERDRLINQDQILGDYNEEELLQEDMRRECIEEMTRYFS